MFNDNINKVVVTSYSEVEDTAMDDNDDNLETKLLLCANTKKYTVNANNVIH